MPSYKWATRDRARTPGWVRALMGLLKKLGLKWYERWWVYGKIRK